MAVAPTKISDSGSPQRVAYDLMLHIAKTEPPVDGAPPTENTGSLCIVSAWQQRAASALQTFLK
jgi:hypothetical protein